MLKRNARPTLMPQRREHRKGRFTYLLDDAERTAWIKSGHIGRCKTYHVPDHVVIDGVQYTVTSIEMGAFNHPRTLKHLIIPDTITYIDEDTLIGFPNLRSVHIGKGLEYMLNWHFRNCPKLRIITINKANPYLKIENGLLLSQDGEVLVRTFFSRAELHIPEGVQYIEKVAFWFDDMLAQIHFPTTLKEISDNSFSNLPRLHRLVLPEGLTQLKVQSFMQCRHLEYVDLPSTLTDFGRENFTGCDNLRTLILRSPKVMTCEPDDIFEIPLSSQICVPTELVEEYKTHPVWSNFENIQSISDYEK